MNQLYRLQHRPAVVGRIAAILLPAFLVSIAGFSGCTKTEAAPQTKSDTAVAVELLPIRIQPVQRRVEAVGTLFGDEDTLISNKVPGKVIAIFKDVGDRVSPAQPLAQLLPKDYELARQQKRMLLAESLAKLGASDVPGADYDVTQMPTVRRARLQLANSEDKLSRDKQLHDQKMFSDQDFSDAQTAMSVARSSYDAELLAAKAVVAEARTRKSDLDVAEQALSDTTVRAPQPAAKYLTAGSVLPSDDPDAQREHSYVVVERRCNKGELENQITPLFRLVDDGAIKLRALVPERYVSEVAVGQPVDVKVEAYPQTFQGTLSRLNPQIDPANRTFLVEVLIPNPHRLVLAGAFGRASIHTHLDEKVLFVPEDSVVSFAGTDKVFIVEGGKAKAVAVKLGEARLSELPVVPGNGTPVLARNYVEVVAPTPAERTQGIGQLEGTDQVAGGFGVTKLAPGVAVKVSSVMPGSATRSADAGEGAHP